MDNTNPPPETAPPEPSSPGPPPTSWPALTALEQRVLGVLVEKGKTTPEGYPLSLNALTTGCNQKTNRDPVTNLSEDQVESTLDNLQKQGLVTRVTGSRVDRWRHNLYEQWQVDKIELAILAELLLRGAQTEGELRGHAGRMEPIADLETLRHKLRPLAERNLVVFLGAEGRRGTQISHGLQSAGELDRLRVAGAAAAAASERAPAAAGTSSWQAEVAALRQQVQDLQEALRQVQDDVRHLKTSLGA
ncbi:MAG: YceH family protein [Gemmataceae bacterium]|nr:YceH family protein [Gemmataceae bacterium]